MNDIECPYCAHDFDICNDDGFGLIEGSTHQQECPNCEKTFVFTTCISFDYTPEKADCLNGGEHDFRPTHTCPKAYTKMRCFDCDEKRVPTGAEKIEHGIPNE